MIAFLFKRLLWTLATLWTVFTVSFFLMRAVPGGPLDRERPVDAVVRANLEKRYHLDEPVATQYLRELGNVARGDLGVPFRIKDFTVNEVIAQGLPVSAALGLFALCFALALGLTAGVVSAAYRNWLVDLVIMSAATIGIALPVFVVSGLLLILLVFVWPIFPAGGWGTFKQLVLPGICLGLPYAAYIARLARTGMIDVLGQDYIRTARAKGLPERTVLLRHALKAGLLPVVSFLGPAIAGIMTGSLIVEQIFYIPGLGVHFVQAAIQRDYTLAMGMVLLYTALLSVMNLIVDITYTLLDPRVKLQ